MTKERFKEICTLFGGQSETARLLGLKSARRVRRVIKGECPLNPKWIETLKVIAIEKAGDLMEFSENEAI